MPFSADLRCSIEKKKPGRKRKKKSDEEPRWVFLHVLTFCNIRFDFKRGAVTLKWIFKQDGNQLKYIFLNLHVICKHICKCTVCNLNQHTQESKLKNKSGSRNVESTYILPENNRNSIIIHVFEGDIYKKVLDIFKLNTSNQIWYIASERKETVHVPSIHCIFNFEPQIGKQKTRHFFHFHFWNKHRTTS